MTENNETESDPQNTELQRSPGSVCSHQETKLQRLKRSLSFKTILRSKSVENFFQRSNSEVKFPAEILPPPPTPPPTPPTAFLPEGPPINEPPTRKSHQASLPLKPVRTHNFQEFVFKKPTFCDICHHMIVGYSKRGWRCKLCKINAHPQCGEDASQQHCIGKLPMGFRRNFSSPLLIHEQYGFVKEAMPIAPLENGTVVTEAKKDSAISIQVRKSSVRKDMLQMHTYVALYKFMPQEHNDLGLQQGDRIVVTDDSNEDWWKGKIGDRVGFFPANFVQRVRPGERVWQCNRTFQGSKEQGQLPLKELQICVGRGEETNGFVKVCSGKKRGIVPADILKEI
ncbi:SH3 and cysteine-rich domain-containing protein 2-like isoform X2 [Carcharodon carcharias]|uniref:SH3 and cysteine-rich domain-containing protein 2-like isoform X2 n=1 Tax=Carcharodon carcharias TaxID=13397 RepID=UPI001B7F6B80|nr:SH3 and cysteine-rich domain-containing protein 2-like isoform X2 [Carcharodon carcharias]